MQKIDGACTLSGLSRHWKRTLHQHNDVSFLSAWLALLLLLGAMTSQPVSAEPIVVKHTQGEAILPTIPKRIVVLDFASLETLDAIGVDVVGVVNTLMPDHLAKYRGDGYAKIGTLFEPDYEAINAVRPDLIIISGRSAPKYAELSKIAPTIDLQTDDKDHLASSIASARTLGHIFGKDAEIDALVAKLETSIAAVRKQATGIGRGLIILTTGGKMSAYGPQSRFGALHRDLGILPAVEGLDTAIHGQGVSFELIWKSNPEWLFVVDRDIAVGKSGQPASQLLDNPLVTKTTAWQQGQVVYLDPVRWYLVGGGIVSLQASVDQIANAFAAKRM